MICDPKPQSRVHLRPKIPIRWLDSSETRNPNPGWIQLRLETPIHLRQETPIQWISLIHLRPENPIWIHQRPETPRGEIRLRPETPMQGINLRVADFIKGQYGVVAVMVSYGALLGKVLTPPPPCSGRYRGTSLIGNPSVGPYSSPMPRNLW